MLVHTADTTGDPKLSDQIDRRAASNDDVPMGSMRGAFRGICHCAEFQHSNSDPAAVFLRALFGELGAVFEISAVSVWDLEVQVGREIGILLICICLLGGPYLGNCERTKGLADTALSILGNGVSGRRPY